MSATAEERARAVVPIVMGCSRDWDRAEAAIAAAIREAVEAEREACAALADALMGPYGGPDESVQNAAAAETAHELAARIRDRGQR